MFVATFKIEYNLQQKGINRCVTNLVLIHFCRKKQILVAFSHFLELDKDFEFSFFAKHEKPNNTKIQFYFYYLS